MKKTLTATLAGVTAISGAQSFIDGGFDSGNLNAWTVTPTTNGTTLFQQVSPIDIDGNGGLGVSNAGDFSVGQVVFQSGVPAGIYLTQSINLTSGSAYTISFNWSAQRFTGGSNAQGGIFDLVVNGTSLANAAAGSTSPTTPKYGFLTANYVASFSGAHDIGVLIQRPFTVPSSDPLHQFVDNFSIVPEPATMVVLAGGLLATLRRRRK